MDRTYGNIYRIQLIFGSLERGKSQLFKKQRISGIGAVVPEIATFENKQHFYESADFLDYLLEAPAIPGEQGKRSRTVCEGIKRC